MTFEAAKRSTTALDKKIDALSKKAKELDRLLLEIQSKCPHDVCVETRTSYPPKRACTACGYTEVGWHCGFWQLPNSYDGDCVDGKVVCSVVSFEAFAMISRGPVVHQDEMEGLGRWGRDRALEWQAKNTYPRSIAARFKLLWRDGGILSWSQRRAKLRKGKTEGGGSPKA